MINGKTSSGFEFSVRPDAGEDWRLVDAMSDTQSDNRLTQLMGTRNVCKILLGEDGYRALEKHLQHDDGFIDTQDVNREISEIFTLIGDSSKN